MDSNVKVSILLLQRAIARLEEALKAHMNRQDTDAWDALERPVCVTREDLGGQHDGPR